MPARIACLVPVDLLDDEIGPADAKTLPLKFGDELNNQPADILVDRFRCTDRFSERSNDLDEFWATDRIYRFGNATEHLVETPSDLRAEAKRQGSARRHRQLANRPEAEHAQINHDLLG